VGRQVFAVDQHAAHERILLEQLQIKIFGESGLEVNISSHKVDIRVTITQHQFSLLQQFQDLAGKYKWHYKLQRTYNQ
jgi:DNA mismatch repair ATPase MutL